jgi:tetratricopeptide (TPR) repeat protein
MPLTCAVESGGCMFRHFISYSKDGFKFARRLASGLQGGDPPIHVWLNTDRLKPGSRWPSQIEQTVRQSASVLFVVTKGSVREDSVCANELEAARAQRKTIIPLLVEPGVAPPFTINDREHIDFTELDYEVGFDRLRAFLWELDEKVQQSDAGKMPATGQSAATKIPKLVHPIPPAEPDYFQDRIRYIDGLWQFLDRASKRLCVVLGHHGIGKTAIVSRVLVALHTGSKPESSKVELDGIVYLDAREAPSITALSLLVDLTRLLSDEPARSLDPLLSNAEIGIGPKIEAVVKVLQGTRALLVIDNFERLLDSTTREVADGDLRKTLTALVMRDRIDLKVVLVTTKLPGGHLMEVAAAGRSELVDVAKGLDPRDAAAVLKALDTDWNVGLRGLPSKALQALGDHVDGQPRALEVLHAYMATNPWVTPQKILSEPLPEQVLEALIGRTFVGLDERSQQIMKALAVYQKPVPPDAIDYLLHPYVDGIDSQRELGILRRLHLVVTSDDGARYHLPHGPELAYVRNLIPADEEAGGNVGNPSFSLLELSHRGAEYFSRYRNPEREPHDLKDLTPRLTEIDLRQQAREYPLAAWLLLQIDHRYLLPWGEHGLVFERHQALAGTLGNRPDLEQARLGMLGNASVGLEEEDEAIEYYRQALEITRDIGDPRNEKHWLSNIGSCYYRLGQLQNAINYFEQARDLAHELDDQRQEVAPLVNLSLCYWDMGKLDLAMDLQEQAHAMARDMGDRAIEARQLINLGALHAQRGEWPRAQQRLDSGLVLARAIGYRKAEGDALGELALLRMDQQRMDEAVALAEQAVEVTERHGSPELGRDANYVLALAYLSTRAVLKAQGNAELACHKRTRAHSYDAFALLGVIALRLHDHAGADEAFGWAMGRAETALEDTPHNLAALDAKGLALSGLVLLGDHERAAEAIGAYQGARHISQAPGVISRVLRLLDCLAPIDDDGRLVPVRAAAGGTASTTIQPERWSDAGA